MLSFKTLLRCLLLPVLVFVITSQSTDPVFRQLWVLEGLWRMETRRGPLFEQWTKTNDSTLTGRSYRLNGSDTLILENLRLIDGPDGILYIPTVANQNNSEPVPFRLIGHRDNRFTFENPQHDFPQRIIYTIVSTDSLVAHIEGISKGKAAASHFYYKRVR